jgi:hypothetical protein
MRLFRFASLTFAVALALLVGFFVAPTAVRAQQDTAAMTGVVTDASGAVLPDATITLFNKLTGVSYTQTTDKLGSYRFVNVKPAQGYEADFLHSGFATYKINSLDLEVGVTRTQNAKLNAGSNVQVEVSSNQEATIDTTDATVGNNMDVQMLNELPILDRTTGIATLFLQQPGVDSYSGAVTGARTDQTEVTLDGIDVNDLATGQAFSVVANAPVDSVEEFHGTVAGMTPSVGTGSGGQFQLVTKSGTNKFHGNINEYNRNTDTEANSYFNNLTGLPRTPLIRNQFGGNIGGPIKKDKLYFFFDVADSRIIQSNSNTDTVPLSNLTSATPTLNYINSGAGCSDASRINTQPTCITALSPAQVASFDPNGIGFNMPLLSFISGRYPAANEPALGDGVNTGGYHFTYAAPDNSLGYIGRVDYNLSQNHRIFGRFTIARENSVSNQSPPEFGTDPVTHPIIDRSYGYVVSDTWTISKNKVNQFYYGDNISKLSFPDEFNPTGIDQYGFSGISGPYTAVDGQRRRVPIPVVRDDFNWLSGNHSITFGGTFKFIKTNEFLLSDFNGVGVGLQGTTLQGGLGPVATSGPTVRPYDIFSDATGTAVTDYDTIFALGLGTIGDIGSNFNYSATGALPEGSGTTYTYRYFQTELYFGDTWKVNRQLTLSYGLRYQYYSVPYEVNGKESIQTNISYDDYMAERVNQNAQGITGNNAVPFISYTLGGKANHAPPLYTPSYKDIAPRIAFDYTPSFSPKTVISGSAGIVYDRTVVNAVNFIQSQLSPLFSSTATNQFSQGTNPTTALMNDTRVGTGLSYPSTMNPTAPSVITPVTPFVVDGQPVGFQGEEFNYAVNPTLKDPYSIAFNLGIQRDLPNHMLLKVSYVGRLGRDLIAQADAGQIIDFPDAVSGQMFSAAMASLTTQIRGGANYATITPIPWFENVLGAGQGAAIAPGFFGIPSGIITSNTAFVAADAALVAARGDASDTLLSLADVNNTNGTPLLPTNAVQANQFASDTFITNKGSSSYNGLLVTLTQNMSHGLQFSINYTWSHSIDNTSLVANSIAGNTGIGYICDDLHPRACRGSSDFDVRQEITSNFVYNLPFGRGKEFMATTPQWVDEAIGGWSISGLPTYRTGLSMNVVSDAFLSGNFTDDPAVFTGNRNDLKAHVNLNKASQTVFDFANGQTGASKAFADFAGPVGIQYGQRNFFNGPGSFYFDAGLAKTFPIIEGKLNLKFRADAFNVLNHPVFTTPGPNIAGGAGNFGQITTTSPSAGTAAGADAQRVAQFSLRLEF